MAEDWAIRPGISWLSTFLAYGSNMVCLARRVLQLWRTVLFCLAASNIRRIWQVLLPIGPGGSLQCRVSSSAAYNHRHAIITSLQTVNLHTLYENYIAEV